MRIAYFVSNYEIGLLILYWIDTLLKLLYTTWFNRMMFYMISVMLATHFIHPHLRNHAIISGLLYFPSSFICMFVTEVDGVLWFVLAALPIINTVILLKFGRFEVIDPTGPYGVGHKFETIETKTGNILCSIFYPIDKEEYDNGKDDPKKNIGWFGLGSKGLSTVSKLFESNSIFEQDITTYRIACVKDADLHKDFSTKSKKLTPVISSHGLMSSRNRLSGITSEMASQGCIVLCLDHTDGSSFSYCDENEEEVGQFEDYDKEVHKCKENEYRAQQLDTRMQDIEKLLDFAKENFPDDKWNIEWDHLVAFGHSFGGISAVEMCQKFPENFKICIALDPYYMPRYKEIEGEQNYCVKQPLLLLNSEFFYKDKSGPVAITEFDGIKCGDKLFKDSKTASGGEQNHNITIKGTGHSDMCDERLYYYNVFKKFGHCVGENIYEVFISAVLAYMGETGYLPVKYPKSLDQVVKQYV
ncbi:unnamed protein product [Moneuplotes crassus]|uniref:1-alkyl-2-acetylglycerophosphocholine esterase n=2 Tax=Euplotes crassus TaxID=5936 RepID=A0AAD1XAQ4_EUPCR|nr:unnamed protein product [Moneuplotes crassus]